MERISALMDGELDARDADREVARLKDDAQLRSRWDEFHVVGDALRGERLLSAAFGESLSRRLAEEPTVLAPHRRRIVRRVTTYAMSAAASLAAIGLVTWVALTPTPMENIALKPQPLPVTSRMEAPRELASVPSDGRMNEYLLAHESFSPSTALQGLAPYIRTVATHRPIERR